MSSTVNVENPYVVGTPSGPDAAVSVPGADIVPNPPAEAWQQSESLASRSVLGMRVDATSYEDASRRVVQWAREKRSAYVRVATVNDVMQAFDSDVFRQLANEADLVTPDGRPLFWALKGLGRETPLKYGERT